MLPPGSWRILPGGDTNPSTLQQPPKWLRCAQRFQAQTHSRRCLSSPPALRAEMPSRRENLKSGFMLPSPVNMATSTAALLAPQALICPPFQALPPAAHQAPWSASDVHLMPACIELPPPASPPRPAGLQVCALRGSSPRLPAWIPPFPPHRLIPTPPLPASLGPQPLPGTPPLHPPTAQLGGAISLPPGHASAARSQLDSTAAMGAAVHVPQQAPGLQAVAQGQPPDPPGAGAGGRAPGQEPEDERAQGESPWLRHSPALSWCEASWCGPETLQAEHRQRAGSAGWSSTGAWCQEESGGGHSAAPARLPISASHDGAGDASRRGHDQQGCGSLLPSVEGKLQGHQCLCDQDSTAD